MAMDTRNTRDGFTILELIVVLTLSAVMLSIVAISFTAYMTRTSAHRAAQVFARDLVLARSTAMRGRETVVIRFYEASRWYEIATVDSGKEVVRRRLGVNGDIELSGVTLDLAGDTVFFDSRGMADLTGAMGPLGSATFSSGSVTYEVSFNSMGASRIERK